MIVWTMLSSYFSLDFISSWKAWEQISRATLLEILCVSCKHSFLISMLGLFDNYIHFTHHQWRDVWKKSLGSDSATCSAAGLAYKKSSVKRKYISTVFQPQLFIFLTINWIFFNNNTVINKIRLAFKNKKSFWKVVLKSCFPFSSFFS